MSNPMVGDTVLYHPGPTDHLARFGSWPLAAIVVSVSDEGIINLCIFDPDGAVSHRAEVQPRQKGKKHHEGSFEVRGAKPAAKPEDAKVTPTVTPYQEGVQARRDQQAPGNPNPTPPAPMNYQPTPNPPGYVQGQTDYPNQNQSFPTPNPNLPNP